MNELNDDEKIPNDIMDNINKLLNNIKNNINNIEYTEGENFMPLNIDSEIDQNSIHETDNDRHTDGLFNFNIENIYDDIIKKNMELDNETKLNDLNYEIYKSLSNSESNNVIHTNEEFIKHSKFLHDYKNKMKNMYNTIDISDNENNDPHNSETNSPINNFNETSSISFLKDRDTYNTSKDKNKKNIRKESKNKTSIEKIDGSRNKIRLNIQKRH